jgi:SPOR domain
MMKVLFLFFLLLNGVYFFWQLDDSDAPASSTILKQPALPTGVEKLTLLRERGLGSSNTVSPASVKESPRTTKPVSDIPEPPRVAEVPKKPVEKPRAVTKPQKSLIQKREPACFTLGPFAKADVASITSAAISTLDATVEHRESTRRTPKSYWVYLPPSKSYQAARRKVKELRKKGLKDLFIMGEGSRKNAISLGLFKRKSASAERLQRVKKLGLQAVLETQYRVSKQDWLDMTVAGGKVATVAAISEIADGLQQAELSQRKCQ